MIVLRILSAVLGLVFAGAIIWGFVAGGSVVPVLAMMLAEPWGVVTLADLYLGFVLVAGLVVLLEPERRAGVLWGIAIVLLGNVITAAWIVIRLPHVLARLRST
ncbi:DUF1475 family protein [uncultured Parvibaculum sp.]|uniref:DUF1475 family protein n=1 Tax=uncultured Parvibaculum sp. TaxID=291828 RepID=UPI0030DAA5BC|tara:strand:- start:38245 stop:38556 length:312 start_codon:yes stop_codon:yes gene_type:complete